MMRNPVRCATLALLFFLTSALSLVLLAALLLIPIGA